MDPGMIFIILLVLLALSFRTFRPLANALADILRSRFESVPRPAGRDDEIEGLRDAVESLSNEVARLTERVDFTERLLQKPKSEGSETEETA